MSISNSKIENVIMIFDSYKGGALTFIEQHIKYLSKKNKNIIIFTDKNNFQDKTILYSKNIKIYKLNIFSPTNIERKKLKQTLQKYHSKNTIIFIVNYAIFVYYFFYFKNIKCFLTIHSGLLSKNIKRYFLAFIFSIISFKVFCLRFGSNSALSWWIKKFPWMNRSSKVFYNGIILKKNNIKKINKTLRISFAGRLEQENDPYLFCEIAKKFKVKNVEFKIYGDGSQLAPLKKKYSTIITFKGWKKPNEIYSNTEILLICSPINNYPYAALEAKNWGIPVISCSKGDIRKIIKNNIDGYICKNNKEDFIKKIRLTKKRYFTLTRNTLNTRKNFEFNKLMNKFWIKYL